MIETPDLSTQLETAKTIEERSTKLIKWLFLLIGVGVIGLVFTHFLQVAEAPRLVMVYLMPVLLLVALVFSVKLCKQAPASTSRFFLVIGLFSILGGVAFDMVATVSHTPTLADEGNVVAAGLFKMGAFYPIRICVWFYLSSTVRSNRRVFVGCIHQAPPYISHFNVQFAT